MGNLDAVLSDAPPRTLKAALTAWPVRDGYTPSPRDWRDQVFYFLLPDRFSDGQERPERLLTADLSTPAGVAEIKTKRAAGWDLWQKSGAERFQGGTLAGIRSKLGYLADLGMTTLWIGPSFRQRVEENTYHGYGIQDFLEVDPRFGTRKDLVELVDEAHRRGLYVVLDVIFNHAGCNWLYDAGAGNAFQPPYRAFGSYTPIWPRNGYGSAIYDSNPALGADDYVWPEEIQGVEHYLRAGSGNLGAGDLNDDNAEFRRTDFCNLRKMNLFSNATLNSLALAYHYWIALTDADGFRVDTFKHVTFEQARNFANAIKEYAEELGKDDFFLVAEVAGGDAAQDRYLESTGRNLNACLDIGGQRELICDIAKGLKPAAYFFGGFNYSDPGMPSHRTWGSQHLTISNDHDHVFGSKIRFAADAANDHQAAAVAAMQLFALGIPCFYYGTEQGLASGAEADQRGYLSSWGGHDCLLREAMFGPEHPLGSGWEGTQGKADDSLPGFGPHGTSGWHVFNPDHPLYTRIRHLSAARRSFKPLRRGRQYQRQISFLEYPFDYPGAGQLVAWSRIFDDQEILIVVNPHGNEARGARIVADAVLSEGGMQIVANSDPAAPAALQVGAWLPQQALGDWRYIGLDRDLIRPSEVVVLANRSAVEAAGQRWNPSA